MKSEDLSRAFTARLRVLWADERQATGASQAAFAHAHGFAPSSFSRWLWHGMIPEWRMLDSLATAFSNRRLVTAAYLLVGAEARDKPEDVEDLERRVHDELSSMPATPPRPTPTSPTTRPPRLRIVRNATHDD
jgi:hypothetical protein